MSDADAISSHLMQTGQAWGQPDQQSKQQGRRRRRRRRRRRHGCICGFTGVCDVCMLLV